MMDKQEILDKYQYQNGWWQKWNEPEFGGLYREIEHNTIVDARRRYILSELCQHASLLEGDVAEVGVWRGGCGKLFSKCLPDKKIHLFDTFCGMPSADPDKDDHQEGDLKVDLHDVKSFLDGCNVEFHVGVFPETITEELETKTFRLAHIDVDIYQSVKDAAEFFYPRMSVGGVMVFDDYGAATTTGARIAVDEFLEDKPESLMYLISCQGILIKT